MLEIKMEDGVPSFWNDGAEITEDEYVKLEKGRVEAAPKIVKRYRVSLSGKIREEDG